MGHPFICDDVESKDGLRAGFMQLAKQIFQIDFSSWYAEGGWTPEFRCHAWVENGTVVSNVSVHEIPLVIHGRELKAIQLGTVMTHPEWRGRGLAGKLMGHALEFHEHDLAFLFAHSGVREMYPRFGFSPVTQSRFTCEISLEEGGGHESRKLELGHGSPLDVFKSLARKRCPVSRILGTPGGYHLSLFHTLNVLPKQAFHIPELDVIVFCKPTPEFIHVFDVISEKPQRFLPIARSLARPGQQRFLFHFTPDFPDISTKPLAHEDPDDVLFVLPRIATIPPDMFVPFTARG